MSEQSLQITADGSYTLSRGASKETYHSRYGAVKESTEVFLVNSGVQARLQGGEATRVLEIGFGTGLNFMVSACCAREHQCALSYTAYEPAPPPLHLIEALLTRNTVDCTDEISRLLKVVGPESGGSAACINEQATLQLLRSDALQGALPPAAYDAVYLDAFSQHEAPQFWRAPFLQKLHRTLCSGGTLATYSVNRQFRDSLTEAGFSWQKRRGPAGKREVMVAFAQ